MSEELKQYILHNGLVLGIIYVCLDVLKYLGGPEYFVNTYFGIGSFLLSIIFPIYYLVKYRSTNGGFIDFRSAFSLCTGILIAAGFIQLVFEILLFNIIDTGFASELLDVSINTAVVQLENFGISEEEISKSIEMMESRSNYSPLNMLKGFGFTIVGYTIFGVIVAAIMKKNKPEFSDE